MTINPVPVNPKNRERVAYKGGSEPGVWNLSHYLWTENGTEYFVSAPWNNEEPLEEAGFMGLYQRLI